MCYSTWRKINHFYKLNLIFSFINNTETFYLYSIVLFSLMLTFQGTKTSHYVTYKTKYIKKKKIKIEPYSSLQFTTWTSKSRHRFSLLLGRSPRTLDQIFRWNLKFWVFWYNSWRQSVYMGTVQSIKKALISFNRINNTFLTGK